MRSMIIGNATKESEAGVLPKAEAFAAMGKYNENLLKAGVLLSKRRCIPRALRK